MEAVILAGGLGTRLGSKLHDLPKAMAPIAGRPFLALLLDQLIAAGCTRAILSVGYRRGAIIDAFQHNYRGLPLDYAVEERPLGTGGAIRLSLGRVTEQSTLVLNGDTFLDVDLASIAAFHDAMGRSMTMAVTRVADTARYGGVVLRDKVVSGFTEKSRMEAGEISAGWINAGVYMLKREFPWPQGLPEQFSFERDVLNAHLATLQPAAFRCEGYFLDIGVPEDLDRAQIELARKGPGAI
jgi:D-glycero-alpha-D-manno-heptose 1-phosphate guanylyltransferase